MVRWGAGLAAGEAEWEVREGGGLWGPARSACLHPGQEKTMSSSNHPPSSPGRHSKPFIAGRGQRSGSQLDVALVPWGGDAAWVFPETSQKGPTAHLPGQCCLQCTKGRGPRPVPALPSQRVSWSWRPGWWDQEQAQRVLGTRGCPSVPHPFTAAQDISE